MSATGSVLYCGDPHGNFAHIVHEAHAGAYNGVVLLGDLDWITSGAKKHEQETARCHSNEALTTWQHIRDAFPALPATPAHKTRPGASGPLSQPFPPAGQPGLLQKKESSDAPFSRMRPPVVLACVVSPVCVTGCPQHYAGGHA